MVSIKVAKNSLYALGALNVILGLALLLLSILVGTSFLTNWTLLFNVPFSVASLIGYLSQILPVVLIISGAIAIIQGEKI